MEIPLIIRIILAHAHSVTLDSHIDAVEWARYMECGHALQNECCSDLVTAAAWPAACRMTQI